MIIGIGHQKRVGKDYLAKLLFTELEARGLRTGISHFADAMKNFASQLFGRYGLGDAALYDRYPDLKEVPLACLGGKTPRDIWIAYANAMRAVHPTIWIDGVLAPPGTRLEVQVIPDVRFPREVEAIKAQGGMIIKVHAPSLPLEKDGADDILANFKGWDAVIENDFIPKTMQRAAEDLADAIRRTRNV